MKVAISAQGDNLDVPVDPRFGRCLYFILYDTETEKFEVMDNSASAAGGGAGIQTAQAIVNSGTEAVLTGNVGPNAFKALDAANIKIYTGVYGKIYEALIKLKEGSLKSPSVPSVESHHGLNSDTPLPDKKNNTKRIAVAVETDEGLDSDISAHFGKCPFYMIVEVEDNKIINSFKVENPYFGDHVVPGKIPAFIQLQLANVIIAGGMGQRAVGFFNDFDIEAVTGVSGKVQTIVEDYLQGNVKGNAPCRQEKCDH